MSQLLIPDTLEQALEAMARPEPPVVLAGGTDLWPLWTSGQEPRPEQVLSLHRLEALRRIEWTDGALRIGGACTHAQLVRSAEVRQSCPSLAESAATIGAQQIQNRGTVGGNLVGASPAADLPPPLAAAGASVELTSAAGTRAVPLDRFYLGYRQIDRRPDELLTAVRVPPLPDGAREHFRKVGTRRAQAISKVVGCCRIRLDDRGSISACGLAFGSVGATVVRLKELERWLRGRPADAATADEAGRRASAAVTPIDDLRSSADYRRYLVGQLTREWIAEPATAASLG
jgi:CO/xanthine dehydrogenase FAD-binding subunit